MLKMNLLLKSLGGLQIVAKDILMEIYPQIVQIIILKTCIKKIFYALIKMIIIKKFQIKQKTKGLDQI